MEAALATRDNVRSETGDRGWRDMTLWVVKLINLDLDDDANLNETLCKMAGRDLVRSDKSNRDYCVGLNITVTFLKRIFAITRLPNC